MTLGKIVSKQPMSARKVILLPSGETVEIQICHCQDKGLFSLHCLTMMGLSPSKKNQLSLIASTSEEWTHSSAKEHLQKETKMTPGRCTGWETIGLTKKTDCMMVCPVNEETQVTKNVLRIRISEISFWKVKDEIRSQTAETWQIVAECNLTLSLMNDEPNSSHLKIPKMILQCDASEDPIAKIQSDQLWCHHCPHNPHVCSI